MVAEKLVNPKFHLCNKTEIHQALVGLGFLSNAPAKKGKCHSLLYVVRRQRGEVTALMRERVCYLGEG